MKEETEQMQWKCQKQKEKSQRWNEVDAVKHIEKSDRKSDRWTPSVSKYRVGKKPSVFES